MFVVLLSVCLLPEEIVIENSFAEFGQKPYF